ncbi:hypothetical protein D3C86_1173300 [compost metagenome]
MCDFPKPLIISGKSGNGSISKLKVAVVGLVDFVDKISFSFQQLVLDAKRLWNFAIGNYSWLVLSDEDQVGKIAEHINTVGSYGASEIADPVCGQSLEVFDVKDLEFVSVITHESIFGRKPQEPIAVFDNRFYAVLRQAVVVGRMPYKVVISIFLL